MSTNDHRGPDVPPRAQRVPAVAVTEARDAAQRRENVIHRYETFRRTGHFPLCASRGCDETGCAAARLVSRWEPRRP